jgi:hypothetical protein
VRDEDEESEGGGEREVSEIEGQHVRAKQGHPRNSMRERDTLMVSLEEQFTVSIEEQYVGAKETVRVR